MIKFLFFYINKTLLKTIVSFRFYFVAKNRFIFTFANLSFAHSITPPH